MTPIDGIYRAAIEIAYDNGGINRTRGEDDVRADVKKWLSDLYTKIRHTGYRIPDTRRDRLEATNKWLLELSQGDLEIVCGGEEKEQLAILACAPTGTKELLANMFNAGVC